MTTSGSQRLERKEKLKALIEKYNAISSKGGLDESSEDTARSWINELLSIFGWDTMNPTQVHQGKKLSASERKKLAEISSDHNIPDYALMSGKHTLAFIDAKRISLDINSDKDSSFQIRSYGWSKGLPCSFLTNFKQLAVYDCRFKPKRGESADVSRPSFWTVNQYLEKFDQIEELLSCEKVQNGNLSLLFAQEVLTKGIKSLDQDFAEKLSVFRLQLARHIWSKNKHWLQPDSDQLGYLTQVILDRIVFIRVAESKGIEEDGLLKKFIGDGFWQKFQKASGIEFLHHYDGPMFNGEAIFDKLKLEDNFFDEFVDSLYYPSPYRFDVIPVKLLSDTYETFLDRKIVVQGNGVKEVLRPEYEKAGGAVSTPEYIVRAICDRTLLNLLENSDVGEILKLKLLDPACGSGTFLGVLFDIVEEKLLGLKQAGKISSKFNNWFVETVAGPILTVLGKREIIKNCIYGVDLSSEAVEVARMSLAFKVLEGSERYPRLHTEIGLHGSMILAGIGENVRHGNSLVGHNVFEVVPELKNNALELSAVNPFSYEKVFPEVFSGKDVGFNAIVGNPPYVEVKWFKSWSPSAHEYLKAQYPTCEDGKVDLAVPFIERSLALLRNNGRLGFVVQKRLFKTEYGANVRKLISETQSIEQVLDFQSSSIFKGRMTYVAIIILAKNRNEQLHYLKLNENPPELLIKLSELQSPAESPEKYSQIPIQSLSELPWNFGDPKLLGLKDTLLRRLGTLKQVPNLDIGVGLQMLWGKAYHIRPQAGSKVGRVVNGINGFGDTVKIEAAACCPIICNESFFTFRPPTPDVYGVFPYEIKSGKATRIPFSSYASRYPLAGAYLSEIRNRIKVATREDRQYWHTYTREQNLVRQPGCQVLVPMTVKDTFAAFDESGELYCDNVNVNFIKIRGANLEHHMALAAIINSTLFSVLARLGANPQSGDYYKFNRQFLWPIPFPCENFFRDSGTRRHLSVLANEISGAQVRLMAAGPTNKEPIKVLLRHYWKEVDKLVEKIYGLTEAEKRLLTGESRAVDRSSIE